MTASKPEPGARTSLAESDARLTPPVKDVLANLHPDPFTQAALWRVFLECPIHLEPDTYLAIFGADRAGRP